MKTRTILLAAVAAAVVVTVLATGERGAGTASIGSAPQKAERPQPAKSSAPHAQTWSLSPRRGDGGTGTDASAYSAAPASPGMPEVMFTPATLPGRVAALARQVDSGSGGDPYELFALLNECAATPHRMALSTGCLTPGECGPSQQRMERYQETLAACNQVGPDLIARRQQYLDLAASRGDPRAGLVRQQPL